jgi:hypothetical protein
MQQKLLYTLLIASRKLRHYFQGHPIKVDMGTKEEVKPNFRTPPR